MPTAIGKWKKVVRSSIKCGSDEWEAMKFYRRGKMHAMKRQSVEEDGPPCQSSPCHADALLIVKR